MAVFVPHYEHDIFINYAHVDNEPTPGANEGWVSSLAKGLKNLLAKKLGRSDAFSLWMDYRLSPHKPITSEIMKTIEQAAILIVILSPGYLASEWCRRERNTFLKMIGERPRSEARVFIVERDKIEERDRPDEFKELLGYRFWFADKEGRPPRILGEPKPNPDDPKCQPYYDKLNDLSYDLAEELRRLRALAESPHTAIKKTNIRPTVFLAEVTDELIIQREEVKRYLAQAGFRVLPETPLYFNEPDIFYQAVDMNLEGCEIFVQLLSSLAGRRPPCRDMPGYICIQWSRAYQAGKQILQWHDPSLNLDTITDKEYLKLLKRDTVLAVSLEEFKREAVRRASSKPTPKTIPVCALVFLDVRWEDAQLANEIIKIMEKKDVGYVLPLQKGKPSEIRKDLEKWLLYCDGVIIFYGAVPSVWAREQLLYCCKIMYKRDLPLKALAVYEGPPNQKDPLNIALPGMQIIHCQGGVNEIDLLPFLDLLKSEENP